MKVSKLIIFISVGVIWGFVGVKAVGALTPNFLNKAFVSNLKIEKNKSIEDYWIETGLSEKELKNLITNIKCYSSEKYYNACLNAIISNAFAFDMELSLKTGLLVKLNKSENLDEKTEKELLYLYRDKIKNLNFNHILNELFKLENETKKAILYSRIINSFLSIYFDPHTYILPTSYFTEVSTQFKKSKYFVGISSQKINGIFNVRKVFKNSDAEKSGLKVNDKILALNSVDLVGAQYKELSLLLKNEKIDFLKFKIERKHKILNINLKRSFNQLGHVQYAQLKNGIDHKNYGLLTFTKFNNSVCKSMEEKLLKIKNEKIIINGMILDMRDNPGGQLDEASCIASLFLGKNKVVYSVEYFDQTKSNEVVLTSKDQVYDGPLIVLVNSGSASASELLAGVFKEYGRALVIGERTFGKGTFQEPEEWATNSKISLFKTQGIYLLPSGNSTQLKGIQPDVELKFQSNLTKREDQSYFNPILVKAERYFNKTKSLKNLFSNNRCKNNTKTTMDDLYLNESLNFLSCKKRSELANAQNSQNIQSY